MDLESSRSKQRAAQQQSQTQPDGVARIGDRDPLTGRYTVQFPDGGIGANGIKTYTAASKPGDVVVLFPRPDGSIAIDSEKGSPTIVPDVFNKPVPDAKKGGVWIFYRSAGKLWIGGHQTVPEEIGSADSLASFNSGYHVWGDRNGWIATYQTAERLQSQIDLRITPLVFHCIVSNNGARGQTATNKDLGLGVNQLHEFYYNTSRMMAPCVIFPLGGGFVAFRSIVSTPITITGGDTASGLAYSYSGSSTLSVGYFNLGTPTSATFEASATSSITETRNFSGTTFTEVLEQRNLSFNGTTQIPNIGVQQYKGAYDGLSKDYPGFSANNFQDYKSQSTLTYAIMCDRSVTYYIRETVLSSGSVGINPIAQRKYELLSSVSAQVIATNFSEPRFFGIRWDLRDFNRINGIVQFPATNAEVIAKFYNNPMYYHPFVIGISNSRQVASMGRDNSPFPVGYYRRSRAEPSVPLPSGYDERTPIYDYDDGTPVTYSGGSVVIISALEILKAKTGDGYLVRKVVAVSGAESTITSAYCYAIPANAEILHWSTTTE